ncbi:class I SAM-dependent methyltransferase [Mycolicibacterium helvum]|uniref:Tetracenomycin C synthesis protein n=1 Tax=Mycolicibacterium helvum TaxID=1534349 RepID=A0A7I7T360_9MYCO|nr:class I SAM-dependent methyltransferase [Mycolicibacterium helvum]BBY63717.1 tetracenomycin C synthesis protein [Mycolicibacterium helvum]
MNKIRPELGEVQETLLIPLYGRARDAASRHPVINDRWARDLVDRIDYDFTAFRGGSLPGSVLRTAVFDGWVRRFLDDHPAGTVVDVGTGLNTRFERVDNGSVRWFDLDLPDSIQLRRNFFSDTDRRTMLAGSVLDTDWYDAVTAAPGPYLFVVEAVLVYLREAQVGNVLAQLAQRFPESLIAFDTAGPKMIANQKRGGAMKAVDARMQWTCGDPRALEKWGLRLLDSRTLASPQPEVAAKLPARYRCALPILARIAPGIVGSYRLNLYQLGRGELPADYHGRHG